MRVQPVHMSNSRPGTARAKLARGSAQRTAELELGRVQSRFPSPQPLDGVEVA